jgi:hypothetical protein
MFKSPKVEIAIVGGGAILSSYDWSENPGQVNAGRDLLDIAKAIPRLA